MPIERSGRLTAGRSLIARIGIPAIVALQVLIASPMAGLALSLRTVLVVAAVVTVLLAPLVGVRLLGPSRAAIATFVALSFGTVLLYAYTHSWAYTDIAGLVAVQLIGWTAMVLVVEGAPPASRGRLPSARTLARAGAAIAALSLGVLALAHWAIDGPIAIRVDETIYLLQARLFDEPGFSRPIDAALAPFFTIRQALIAHGRMFTQYPPGWPFILWLFRWAGLQWWAGSLIGAGAVWLTYRLGSRLRSPAAGVVAAALVAVNIWFVQVGGSYHPHAADLFLALLAALLLVRAGSFEKAWDGALGVAAGAALGALVAMRPVTGASLAISLWLWVLLRSVRSLRAAARLSLALIAGALPFIVATLAYNKVTTGDPLTFGYIAVNGPLHRMGFGPRGIVDYGPDGPIMRPLRFTVRIAVNHAAARLSDASTMTLGCGMLWPLLLLGRLYRFRLRVAELACFAVLPVLHFFFFFSEMRFYIVLLPFLFIELGALLEHVYLRSPRLARRMAFAVITGSIAVSAASVAGRQAGGRAQRSTYEAVTRLRDADGKVLVFVASPPNRQAFLFQALYVLNVEAFPGPVIVARDRGPANAELMARFPDHRPYLVRQLDDEQVAGPVAVSRSVGKSVRRQRGMK